MRSIAISVALAALALPAHAILIRADRDDAEYVEMATRYASALWLEPVAAGGVLIAPEWILTHGSAAEGLERMAPRPRLKVGKGEHEIAAVFLSPNRRLGLVHLKSPVKGVPPTAIYKSHDEGGKVLIVVSRGLTGTIGEESRREDARMRAAVNTVDALDDVMLVSKVKVAEDASDLQGAAIAEDRGSPVYLENEDHSFFVAGIVAPDGGAARAGESNRFIRVSTRSAWIERTILEEAKQDLNRLLGDF